MMTIPLGIQCLSGIRITMMGRINIKITILEISVLIDYSWLLLRRLGHKTFCDAIISRILL